MKSGNDKHVVLKGFVLHMERNPANWFMCQHFIVMCWVSNIILGVHLFLLPYIVSAVVSELRRGCR